MDLIYQNNRSLSPELCSDIINLYERDNSRYPGVTRQGLNTNIKDTSDLVISKAGQHWDRINKVLKKELDINVRKYISQCNSNIEYEYRCINSHLTTESFQMQKYNKNQGKYVYHNDYSCDWETKKMREITFLWYLNDVTEGGETGFGKNYEIKPTVGKLILFPAHWTFPHCAKMPISNDKYIITGWLWQHYDK